MEPLRIAVCEDNEEEQKKISAILGQCKIEFETSVFANGEDFLKTYQLGKYDLLLMDIYMGGMTGVEVVTKIRKKDDILTVAFITTSADYALESYRLNALKYIEKPVQKKAVLELLTFAQLKKENTPRLLLKKDGKDLLLPFEHILYVEQKERSLHLYLIEGDVIQVNGKASKH